MLRMVGLGVSTPRGLRHRADRIRRALPLLPVGEAWEELAQAVPAGSQSGSSPSPAGGQGPKRVSSGRTLSEEGRAVERPQEDRRAALGLGHGPIQGGLPPGRSPPRLAKRGSLSSTRPPSGARTGPTCRVRGLGRPSGPGAIPFGKGMPALWTRTGPSFGSAPPQVHHRPSQTPVHRFLN